MIKDTKLASGLLRALSALVDISVWLLVFQLTFLMVVSSVDLYSLLDSLFYGLIIYVALLTFGIPIINSFMTSRFGGSFGKLLTGTRVVKEDGGTHLSFKMAFLRNPIGYAVSGLMLGLGFVWLFVDEKKQTWHDMLVNSLVVVKSKQAYLLAVVSIVVLTMVNVYMGNVVHKNILENKELYSGIFEDIKGEIEILKEKELLVPEDEFELEDIGALH